MLLLLLMIVISSGVSRHEQDEVISMINAVAPFKEPTKFRDCQEVMVASRSKSVKKLVDSELECRQECHNLFWTAADESNKCCWSIFDSNQEPDSKFKCELISNITINITTQPFTRNSMTNCSAAAVIITEACQQLIDSKSVRTKCRWQATEGTCRYCAVQPLTVCGLECECFHECNSTGGYIDCGFCIEPTDVNLMQLNGSNGQVIVKDNQRFWTPNTLLTCECPTNQLMHIGDQQYNHTVNALCQDGRWTPALRLCEIGCTSPTTDRSNTIIVNSTMPSVNNVFAVNTLVQVSCTNNAFVWSNDIDRHKLTATNEQSNIDLTCDTNGRWSRIPIPSCQPTCDLHQYSTKQVMLEPGAKVYGKSRVLDGSKATVICPENTLPLPNNPLLTCTKRSYNQAEWLDRKGNAPTLSCEQTCKELPREYTVVKTKPSDSKVKINDSSRYPRGTNVTVECTQAENHEEHVFETNVPSITLSCDAEGKWKGKMLECIHADGQHHHEGAARSVKSPTSSSPMHLIAAYAIIAIVVVAVVGAVIAVISYGMKRIRKRDEIQQKDDAKTQPSGASEDLKDDSTMPVTIRYRSPMEKTEKQSEERETSTAIDIDYDKQDDLTHAISVGGGPEDTIKSIKTISSKSRRRRFKK